MQAWERDVSDKGVSINNNNLFRSAVSTLQAKSLAIVGASERARWPSDIYKNLRDFGYPGRIALVNQRRTEVFGQRCCSSLRDVPDPSDNSHLILTPAQHSSTIPPP